MQRNIQFVKGVGPAKAKLIQEQLEISTVADLLHYVPFRYVDRSVINKLTDIDDLSNLYQFSGKIISVGNFTFGKKKGLQATFSDGVGSLDLVWYQVSDWLVQKMKIGSLVTIFGKVSFQKHSFQMVHPEMIFDSEKVPTTLVGVYSATEKLTKSGLHSSGISKAIRSALDDTAIQYFETIPLYLRQKYQLMDNKSAIQNIHFPLNEKLLHQAQRTLKFEELFYLQLELLLTKQINLHKNKGFAFEKKADFFDLFYKNHLPFELTKAQKRVVKEINRDLKSGSQMNRLVQGDVGSGKTLVALLAMLLAVDGGFQTALMAPTEILAQQHYLSIQELLKDLPVRIELLIGSLKNKQKLQVIDEIKNGFIHIVIGTHALIEDRVKFQNLGLVVIDEQHRFGVEQRLNLTVKGEDVDVLIMTATPIPRTLRLTTYGDLDVSRILDKPQGRKPIQTRVLNLNRLEEVCAGLERLIAQGHKIYWVCPLVEESEVLDLAAAKDRYEHLKILLGEEKVGLVYGKQKSDEKEAVMAAFKEGSCKVLVATTVIEVGIDVKTANIMVIEHAERYGLSQLHQLRGRVGRGSEEAHCLLLYGYPISEIGKRRLQVMRETEDGFRIAEEDLALRGGGDVLGTKQSGLPSYKLADPLTCGPLLEKAYEVAKVLLKDDPHLLSPQGQAARLLLYLFGQEKIIHTLSSG